MSKYKVLSVLFFSSIIFLGVAKIWVCRVFSVPVTLALNALDISPIEVLDELNNFSVTVDYNDYYLGWAIYYPAYLFFHLAFIYVLYHNKKKIRNRISYTLIAAVSLLLITAVFSKLLGYTVVHVVAYSLFQNLFSLPFILLAIEGSRVLIGDIEKLIERK